MNKTFLNRLKKRPLAHAIGFILATSSVTTIAQESEVTESEVEVEQEKIVITGSRIRRGGFDNAEPTDIILANDASI
jgi:hypothetical protein